MHSGMCCLHPSSVASWYEFSVLISVLGICSCECLLVTVVDVFIGLVSLSWWLLQQGPWSWVLGRQSWCWLIVFIISWLIVGDDLQHHRQHGQQ